jgi:hypothetical protein
MPLTWMGPERMSPGQTVPLARGLKRMRESRQIAPPFGWGQRHVSVIAWVVRP